MFSLKTHNILDYVIGVVLIASPFIFGFRDIEYANNVYLTLGFGLIGYSLITKYYYAIARIIPLGFHMTLDVCAGVVLMLSPYLFNYRFDLTTGQFVLHNLLGLGAVLVVALTRTRTEEAKTIEERRDTLGPVFGHRHRHV